MEEYDAILIAIRRIMRAIDLHSKELVKEVGLTVPQILVMQSILKGGKQSIGKIAADVSLSQATVTNIIDRLERAGLVRRERSDTDRRVVSACLTLDGKSKLEEAPDPMQRNFLREFSALKSWERHMLTASLERVAAMMDAEQIDASPILAPGDLPKTPLD